MAFRFFKYALEEFRVVCTCDGRSSRLFYKANIHPLDPGSSTTIFTPWAPGTRQKEGTCCREDPFENKMLKLDVLKKERSNCQLGPIPRQFPHHPGSRSRARRGNERVSHHPSHPQNRFRHVGRGLSLGRIGRLGECRDGCRGWRHTGQGGHAGLP